MRQVVQAGQLSRSAAWALLAASLIFGTTMATGLSFSGEQPAPVLGEPLPGLVPGGGFRAIVVFKDTASADAPWAALGLEPKYHFTAIPAVSVTGSLAAIEAAAALPQVRYVEHNRPVSLALATATQATNAVDVWKDQYNLTGDGGLSLSIPTLPNATPVTGQGITIAVVDTGVNGNHPDLLHYDLVGNDTGPGRLRACITIIADHVDEDGVNCDPDGHGTHVAGIAAGNGYAARNGLIPNQTESHIGVAPEADLVAVNAGSAGNVLLYPAEALDWVYAHLDEHSIDVVTNSWGSVADCDDPLGSGAHWQITDKIVAAGVPVVFAAGNKGSDPLRLAGAVADGSSPITNSQANNPTPGVLSVANYDDRETGSRMERVAPSSSSGCTEEELLWTYPDVAAPGTRITSTSANYVEGQSGYTTMTGTSMAAPHIAGAVALIRQANPYLSPAQIEQLIIDSATPWQDDVQQYTLEDNLAGWPQGSEPTGWQGELEEPGHVGTAPYWGSNDEVGEWADKTACRITPDHARRAAEGDLTINDLFPNFTDLPDPHRFVCRDFKRGAGLVEVHSAASVALDLADWNFTLPDDPDDETDPTPDPKPEPPPPYFPAPPDDPGPEPDEDDEPALALDEADPLPAAGNGGSDSRSTSRDRDASFQTQVQKDAPDTPVIDAVARALVGGAGFTSLAVAVALRRFF